MWLSEERIDEIRLAVGEVIARSVLRQSAPGLADPVVVGITDEDRAVHRPGPGGHGPRFIDEEAGLALSVAQAMAFESDVLRRRLRAARSGSSGRSRTTCSGIE